MLIEDKVSWIIEPCQLHSEACWDVGGHRVGIRQDVDDHHVVLRDIDERNLEARLYVGGCYVDVDRDIDELLLGTADFVICQDVGDRHLGTRLYFGELR